MMRACGECGWSGQPQRDVCPQCSGARWREVSEVDGRVEAITNVHRAFGVEYQPAQLLALISVDSGGWIVAAGNNLVIGDQVTVGADRHAHIK